MYAIVYLHPQLHAALSHAGDDDDTAKRLSNMYRLWREDFQALISYCRRYISSILDK